MQCLELDWHFLIFTVSSLFSIVRIHQYLGDKVNIQHYVSFGHLYQLDCLPVVVTLLQLSILQQKKYSKLMNFTQLSILHQRNRQVTQSTAQHYTTGNCVLN